MEINTMISYAFIVNNYIGWNHVTINEVKDWFEEQGIVIRLQGMRYDKSRWTWILLHETIEVNHQLISDKHNLSKEERNSVASIINSFETYGFTNKTRALKEAIKCAYNVMIYIDKLKVND